MEILRIGARVNLLRIIFIYTYILLYLYKLSISRHDSVSYGPLAIFRLTYLKIIHTGWYVMSFQRFEIVTGGPADEI